MIHQILAFLDRHPHRVWPFLAASSLAAIILAAIFLGPSGSDERFITACRQAEFSEQQCAFLEAAIRRRNAEDFLTTHAAVSAATDPGRGPDSRQHFRRPQPIGAALFRCPTRVGSAGSGTLRKTEM